MPRLSAKDGPREIRAAVLALKRADTGLRRDINARVRDTMNPVWKSGLAERIGWAPEQVILKGARIAAGNPPSLVAGNATRRWKAGSTLVPRDHWHAFEYGAANRGAKSEYRRTSPRGTVHTVSRRTKAQLRPRRRNGYIIGPTVEELMRRLIGTIHQAFRTPPDKET